MTDVEFSEGRTRLYGSLRVPRDGTGCPGLVFLHGSGPATHADWNDEAEQFAAAGIASLAYDKQGSGRSEGDWTAQTFDDRAREALAALRFLKEQPGIDAARVGLLGMSQGAWVAPMAAADSDEVAFVVALSASGTGPREQDRFRIERQLLSEGLARPEIEEALVVWRERDERLRSKHRVARRLAAGIRGAPLVPLSCFRRSVPSPVRSKDLELRPGSVPRALPMLAACCLGRGRRVRRGG